MVSNSADSVRSSLSWQFFRRAPWTVKQVHFLEWSDLFVHQILYSLTLQSLVLTVLMRTICRAMQPRVCLAELLLVNFEHSQSCGGYNEFSRASKDTLVLCDTFPR